MLPTVFDNMELYNQIMNFSGVVFISYGRSSGSLEKINDIPSTVSKNTNIVDL
jgi:hypothetical protein